MIGEGRGTTLPVPVRMPVCSPSVQLMVSLLWSFLFEDAVLIAIEFVEFLHDF